MKSIHFLLIVSSLMAEYKIDIVFNNVAHNEACMTEWGFACYVQTPTVNILFDTGSEGEILLQNMSELNIDPHDIDLIFISHMHYDHIGGLERVLELNKKAKLFLPASAPDTSVRKLRAYGIDVALVAQPMKITDDIYSTGEMGSEGLKEQALIIDAAQGLCVITGCAHPGIVEIVERTKKLHGKNIYLVLGGFHMMRMNDDQITGIITRLQDLEVEYIGPSHCTGDKAMQAFRNAWEERFIDLGCGATFELP